MKRLFIIFVLAFLYGLSVLYLRVNYEESTGISKSHWNLTELQDGDAKNFFDRGAAIYEGKHYYAGCEKAPIVGFFRPPAYPFFLSISFLLFGVSIKAVIILQLIIASLICILISVIGEMIFGKTAGWISGVLAIFYYPIWNDAVMINSEILSMLLGLAALYFILKFYKSDIISFQYLVFSGLFAGLSALTRGQFFFYSLLFIMFIFNKNNIGRKYKIRYSLYWLSVTLTTVILWSIYAYLSAGVIIFISSQGALSVWWGWSPLVVLEQKYPVWNNLWDKSFIHDDMIGEYLPVKSSFWFLNEAIGFIFKYPWDAFKIGYFKILDSWGFIDIYNGKSPAGSILKIIKLNWDLFLAIPGFIIAWKEKENKLFVKYILYAGIFFTLLCLMTAGLVRYRIPYLDPLLIILASVTVQKIYMHFKLKKSKV